MANSEDTSYSKPPFLVLAVGWAVMAIATLTAISCHASGFGLYVAVALVLIGLWAMIYYFYAIITFYAEQLLNRLSEQELTQSDS